MKSVQCTANTQHYINKHSTHFTYHDTTVSQANNLLRIIYKAFWLYAQYTTLSHPMITCHLHNNDWRRLAPAPHKHWTIFISHHKPVSYDNDIHWADTNACLHGPTCIRQIWQIVLRLSMSMLTSLMCNYKPHGTNMSQNLLYYRYGSVNSGKQQQTTAFLNIPCLCKCKTVAWTKSWHRDDRPKVWHSPSAVLYWCWIQLGLLVTFC